MEILSKLKIESILLGVSFLIFVLGLGLNKSQDMNIDNMVIKTNELSKTLKEKQIIEKGEKIKSEKSDLFFLNNKNLSMINIKNDLDYYNYMKKMEAFADRQNEGTKIKENYINKATKTDLFEYNFSFEMPYIHKYKYYNFIKYMNKNFFYTFKELSYDVKDKKLNFTFSLYSPFKMKKMMVGGKGKFQRTSKNGKYRRK